MMSVQVGILSTHSHLIICRVDGLLKSTGYMKVTKINVNGHPSFQDVRSVRGWFRICKKGIIMVVDP